MPERKKPNPIINLKLGLSITLRPEELNQIPLPKKIMYFNDTHIRFLHRVYQRTRQQSIRHQLPLV